MRPFQKHIGLPARSSQISAGVTDEPQSIDAAVYRREVARLRVRVNETPIPCISIIYMPTHTQKRVYVLQRTVESNRDR